MPPHIRFVPDGSFSLDSVRSFLDGFTPAGRPDRAGLDTREDLVLAFLTDDWDAAAVRLRETEKTVVAEVIGGSADPKALRRQVARKPE